MKTPDYKAYFKGRKITVMGLGLLGRGVGDTEFLAKCGADLTVTDLKTREQLKSSINKLKKFKNIKYVLGEHRLEDFRNRDFILKAADVSLDSPYIAHARKHGVPIEMSASLFAKLAKIPIIGVTGTRGKSTVTQLLFRILKKADKKVLLGGNVLGISTLALLPKVKNTDYALFELDSWQLQGFGDAKISQNLAIFCTFMDDHLAYYKNNRKKYFDDKANIFKFQKKGDILIIGRQALPAIKKWGGIIKSKKIIAPLNVEGFKSNLLGRHNAYNIALAVTAARVLGIKERVIKKAVKSFKGMPGRLELVREVKGVKYYNDTTATTPDATIAALQALEAQGSTLEFPKGRTFEKRIILIAGGSDKNLDMAGLIKEIPKYCKAVVLLSGTGTEKLLTNNPQLTPSSRAKLATGQATNKVAKSMKEAVEKAAALARRGDIILLSPAFASFGMFKNEYDRGEQFNRIVSSL